MRRAIEAAGSTRVAGVAAGLAVLCACAVSTAGRADYPAARDELAQARGLLIEPADSVVIDSEVQAAAQIDAALGELEGEGAVRRVPAARAATELPERRDDRLHLALQHLDAARLALKHDEPEPQRRARRDRAINHIARAEDTIGRALEVLLRR